VYSLAFESKIIFILWLFKISGSLPQALDFSFTEQFQVEHNNAGDKQTFENHSNRYRSTKKIIDSPPAKKIFSRGHKDQRLWLVVATAQDKPPTAVAAAATMKGRGYLLVCVSFTVAEREVSRLAACPEKRAGSTKLSHVSRKKCAVASTPFGYHAKISASKVTDNEETE